jgi:hypothetical protein
MIDGKVNILLLFQEILMKRFIVVALFLFCFVIGLATVASSAVSGKSFSIVYSSDERGAITPCG